MPARGPRSSVYSPLAIARRNAISKGLLGGDRKWLAIGGALWILRLGRKAFGRNETVVALDRLEPGQWMSIRTIAPPTRKERKAAKALRKS